MVIGFQKRIPASFDLKLIGSLPEAFGGLLDAGLNRIDLSLLMLTTWLE
jgi:hypothetical protein